MDVEVIAGRVVLRSDKSPRKPREVTYKCLDCMKRWVRFTEERILLPEPCPYCGGEPRLTSDTRDDNGNQ